jgi:hypothetical protein
LQGLKGPRLAGHLHRRCARPLRGLPRRPRLSQPADLDGFTPAALRRGIGWYFEQTYRHGGDVVGRFRVIRVIRERDGLRVHKEPLGV